MAWLAVMLFVDGAGALGRLAGSPRARQKTAAGAETAAFVFLLGWLYLTGFSHAGAHVPWDDFVCFERLPAHLSVAFILALCWPLPSRVRRGLTVTLLAIARGNGLLKISGPLLMAVHGSRLDDTVSVRVGRDILDRPPGTGEDGRSRMSRPTRSPGPTRSLRPTRLSAPTRLDVRMLGEVDYSKEEFLAKWGRSVVVLE